MRKTLGRLSRAEFESQHTMSHRDNEVRLAKDVWGSVERDAAPELRKGAKSPFQIISDSDGDEGREG